MNESIPVKDYRATHELASAGVENTLFEIPIRRPKPAGTPGDETAVELNATDPAKRIGTSILLKVMAGDQFKAQVSAYYDGGSFNPQGEQVANSTMVSALLGTLTGGITNLGSESGGAELIHKMFSGDAFNVYNEVKNGMTDPSQPRAYLNYVLLDEQMQLSGEQSGVLQTGAASRDNWADLGMPNDITVSKNGYLLVYLSDESHTSVYLDDLRITYSRGKLLEEQHYYPHGLVVQNGKNDPLPNRYLYQGKELQDEGSMQLYDFHARQYDPQIGRFWGVDPMDQFPSGYTGMGNDPANLIDPDGMQTAYRDPANQPTLFDVYRGPAANPFEDGTWSFTNYSALISYFKTGGTNRTPSQGAGKTNDNVRYIPKYGPHGMLISYQANYVIEGKLTYENGVGTFSDFKVVNKTVELNSNGEKKSNGSCPTCLDPSTLGRNLFGSNYIGSKNPKTYGGDWDYSIAPKNAADLNGFIHDRYYDKLNITGASGLFLSKRAIPADNEFVNNQMSILMSNRYSISERFQAGASGSLLKIGATPKIYVYGIQDVINQIRYNYNGFINNIKNIGLQ